MKKKAYLLLLPFLFAACDDNNEPGSTSGNTNSNAARIEAGLTVKHNSESIIDVKAMASRMEMPQLKGGSDNLFLVHTVGSYGVNYAMEYDCSKKASRWTAYRWDKRFNHIGTWNRYSWKTGETFNGYGGTGDPFQPDPLISSAYQTTLSDHQSNGYDRGHMLGSADRLASKEANGQTFYLSNIHPQLNGFNASGIWYTLEDRLRSMYDQDSFRDTLYIVKGGTIDTDYSYVKGKGNNLICPKYFFMALLCKNSDTTYGGYKAIAFWMEHKANTDTKVISYAISIDELEKKTGIDFFCNLPDDIEEVVESNMSTTSWKLSQ